MRAAKKTIKMLPEIFRCLAAPNRQTKFPVLLAAFVAASAIVRAAEPVPGPDFTREVLPILSQHCFNCHGPDENSRKAGLRLDVREAALQSGDSDGAAIVPGQPDASALLARVLWDAVGAHAANQGSRHAHHLRRLHQRLHSCHGHRRDAAGLAERPS